MGSEGATITFSSDPKNGSACLLCIGDGKILKEKGIEKFC